MNDLINENGLTEEQMAKAEGETPAPVVQDIGRPDVSGVAPKMQAIRDQTASALQGLAPDLKVSTDDNLCSSVYVRGSFTTDPTNGIWQNGLYFQVFISPPKGKRYYSEGDKVTLELSTASYQLKNNKLRKYTGPIDNVLVKLSAWIQSNQPD